ncbi:MAG: sulfur carrier protein ThiS [Candidatus Woesearchaeota archaeon]
MELVINGEKKEVDCKNVVGLLSSLELNKDAVAVELNKNIVHRQEFDKTELKDKDVLEIVKVVGGG